MSARLHPTTLAALPATVRQPAYTPAQHGVGIAHLGIGAFHRAHQAWYLDETLARAGGDWRICGISCRSGAVQAQLQPQAGLYSIAERSGDGERYRVIGSIAEVIMAPQAPELAIDMMARESTRLIMLTVTEKAYQRDAPDVAHDLAIPGTASSAMGLLAAALKRRFEQRGAAPTVLSCDNLRDNGVQLRARMLEFAAKASAGFSNWMEREVCFPNSMVDRIVPATTADDLLAAERALGVRDEGLVVTEPFSQWVIEDHFAGPRPALELAGAQLVRDVRPFEIAKLRLLNCSHSTLAYLGSLLGHSFVHEAIEDTELRALISRLMGAELAPTLEAPPGLDLATYQQALLARFANPALRYRLRQIAMDGSQKLPQRLLTALLQRLKRGEPVAALTLALAAWMRYVIGCDEQGARYSIDDPMSARIAAIVTSCLVTNANTPSDLRQTDAVALSDGLLHIEEIFGSELPKHREFRRQLQQRLTSLLQHGARAALRETLNQPASN